MENPVPRPQSGAHAQPPAGDVIGVPKWFMVLTMGAVVTLGMTGIGFVWNSSLQGAVVADRQERMSTSVTTFQASMEAKLDKIENSLAAAAKDRWTSAQDAAQDARLEHSLRRDMDKLAQQLRRLEENK